MRIKILFTPNTQLVPNNQSVVNSHIHKCLGNNEYHDKASDYNISRLLGGEIIDGGRNVKFDNGGYILVSSLDFEFINKIIIGIMANPDLGFGMKFKSIEHIEEMFFNGWNYFLTTNMGFLLKNRENRNDKTEYYTLDNPNIVNILKEHIINKFSKINPDLKFSDLDVQINQHPAHKVKNVYVKQVKNIVNICQINIHTNEKLAEYLYNYGIGQSTGSGFGTIYTMRSRELYR